MDLGIGMGRRVPQWCGGPNLIYLFITTYLAPACLTLARPALALPARFTHAALSRRPWPLLIQIGFEADSKGRDKFATYFEPFQVKNIMIESIEKVLERGEVRLGIISFAY